MRTLSQDRPDELIANRMVRAGYLRWQPGDRSLIHSHEGAGEVFVFLAGVCEIETDTEVRRFGVGETVYIPAGERHRLTAVSEDELIMFFVVAPNDSPTHTFYRSDGSRVPYDRALPGPDGNLLPAQALPDDVIDEFPDRTARVGRS